jgi:hypothetical protein
LKQQNGYKASFFIICNFVGKTANEMNSSSIVNFAGKGVEQMSWQDIHNKEKEIVMKQFLIIKDWSPI